MKLYNNVIFFDKSEIVIKTIRIILSVLSNHYFQLLIRFFVGKTNNQYSKITYMNKIITYLLCFAVFAVNAYGTNYYVDSNGNDTNDGLSWETAVKTLGKAGELSTTGDNVYVKSGTYSFTGTFAFGNASYYGGFNGNEASPSERLLTDNDGNGITEPWEFQYPTLLSTTYNNGSAFTFPSASITFNGFTFTHVATRTTAGTLRTVNIPAAFPGVFENNTIKDCVLSATMTASIGGMLMTASGVVKNCLFENNQTSCSSTADVAVMLGVDALINSKISNCVFRNNKATANWSIGTSANANLRGFVLNMAPSNTATDKNTVKNCLFYNNEAVFVGNTGNPTSTNGAIVALSSFSASASTDSIINCTFANNKSTSMKTAGLNVIKSGTAVKWVLNNAFWNNKLDGNVKNLQIGTSLASGYIGNNIMNGGGVAGATGAIPTNTYCKDNLIDLSNNNADSEDTKAPRFKTPTTVVGNTNDGSVALAVWTLEPNTYLFAKGVATTVTKDKAGVNFAATPSVGAYEYVKVTPVITWTQDLTTLKTGGADVTLTASSDSQGGSDITYTSSDENVVTVSGSTLTIVGVGSATVTAHQAASTFYNEATDIPQSVVVTKDIGTGINQAQHKQVVSVVNSGIIANVVGALDIYAFNGQQLKKVHVQPGQMINMAAGSYIVRVVTEQGIISQKIVLY